MFIRYDLGLPMSVELTYSTPCHNTVKYTTITCVHCLLSQSTNMESLQAFVCITFIKPVDEEDGMVMRSSLREHQRDAPLFDLQFIILSLIIQYIVGSKRYGCKQYVSKL